MQRPTSVTVFGILNIVFGVIGILAIFGTVALFFMPQSSTNPVIKIMSTSPAYATWLKLTILLGLLGGAANIVAGVGLLQLKEWGRKLSIGYGIFALLIGVIGIAMNFIYLIGPMLELARQSQGAEAAGAVGGAFGGTIGGFVGLIYPFLLIIFMARPKVVAAFRPLAS